MQKNRLQKIFINFSLKNSEIYIKFVFRIETIVSFYNINIRWDARSNTEKQGN